jgi:periplasmic copper chaperone A
MKIYRFHVSQFVSIVFLTLANTDPLLAQSAFDLQVTDAWIRWLPANLPGAGYMTLTNRGSTAQLLIGASSSDYEEITLHQTRKIGGMNGMAPIDGIKLAPKASVNFEREGYHLMLSQPHRSIRAGERIAITLRFSSGQSITVPFAVRGVDQNTHKIGHSHAARPAVAA